MTVPEKGIVQPFGFPKLLQKVWSGSGALLCPAAGGNTLAGKAGLFFLAGQLGRSPRPVPVSNLGIK
jgi:hypothetical protein